MEDDNMFRIDADKDALTEMLKFKAYIELFSLFCPEDDSNFRKLKACLMIFMEHGIPLNTGIDILKEMVEKMNKIDEEEK
jgi:hypothetical protein